MRRLQPCKRALARTESPSECISGVRAPVTNLRCDTYITRSPPNMFSFICVVSCSSTSQDMGSSGHATELMFVLYLAYVLAGDAASFDGMHQSKNASNNTCNAISNSIQYDGRRPSSAQGSTIGSRLPPGWPGRSGGHYTDSEIRLDNEKSICFPIPLFSLVVQ